MVKQLKDYRVAFTDGKCSYDDTGDFILADIVGNCVEALKKDLHIVLMNHRSFRSQKVCTIDWTDEFEDAINNAIQDRLGGLK